jgi:hypothetical protein
VDRLEAEVAALPPDAERVPELTPDEQRRVAAGQLVGQADARVPGAQDLGVNIMNLKNVKNWRF